MITKQNNQSAEGSVSRMISQQKDQAAEGSVSRPSDRLTLKTSAEEVSELLLFVLTTF